MTHLLRRVDADGTADRAVPVQLLRVGSDRAAARARKAERKEAKFWTDPAVELEWNAGFATHELNVIRRLIEEHREYLVEQWHDTFGQ